ncbi:MAG: Crp/Fnr family transcriptional regulator, partial [Bacteroidales bacterium]|nr:Crp/Fnr family transcriptional regulator [Bacteroidales bacterium]
PDLSEEQEELILSAFRQEHYKKKEMIFKQGDRNTRHYIIEKGLARLFLNDYSGKEFNILFAKENQIIGDLSTPEPSSYFLEAIETSIVWSMDDGDMKKLMKLFPDTALTDSGSYMQRSYLFIQKRLVSILSKTAEENYLEFRDKHPELVQRLPQYHIASYLGISAEFLSKIIARSFS